MKKPVFAVLVIILLLLAITLAACNNKVYNIHFRDGNQILMMVQITGSERVMLPPDPEKEGYIFEGWYFDKEFTREFTPTSPLKNEPYTTIDVFAKFRPIGGEETPSETRTITFDTNGGSGIPPVSKAPGSEISAPADPTKEGYIFGGWYTDNGTFNNAFTFNVMPEADITLYARWIADIDITETYLGYDTPQTFTVDAFNSVKYSFTVDGIYVVNISLEADSAFAASLIKGGSLIKSYNSSSVKDSLFLGSGEYFLQISKAEQDTEVTTRIRKQTPNTDGSVRIDDESKLCLVRFSSQEQYDYTISLAGNGDRVLFDLYDSELNLLEEGLQSGHKRTFYFTDYYLLFYGESYTGKVNFNKASRFHNTSIDTAEPVSFGTTIWGELDVPDLELFYDIGYISAGTIVEVRALPSDPAKNVNIMLPRAQGGYALMAGYAPGTMSSYTEVTMEIYGRQANGVFIVTESDNYYVRIGGHVGSFSFTVHLPSASTYSIGSSAWFYVSPNTNYYFRVYVPSGTTLYLNTYVSDNANRVFPLYTDSTKSCQSAFNAYMFTANNQFGNDSGSMRQGSNSNLPKNVIGDLCAAYKASTLDDYYYICIKVHHNASGGYMILHFDDREV